MLSRDSRCLPRPCPPVPARSPCCVQNTTELLVILPQTQPKCGLNVAKLRSTGKGRTRRPECGHGKFAHLNQPAGHLEPPATPREAVSPPGRRRAQHLQREPPRLRGSVDLGAAPLAAERGRAAAARAGRGAGPPSCSRKAARGGAATLGAELRA